MALSKFPKTVAFMSSFLPFTELHAPDNNFTTLSASVNGTKVTLINEGNYTQFIDIAITLFNSTNGDIEKDLEVQNTIFDGVKTYIFLTNSPTISVDSLAIKNEDINGVLDTNIANMAYQMAIRFNIAFGMPLEDLQDEANYTDIQLSVIAQMCCVYYLQRVLYGVFFNVNYLNKAQVDSSESSTGSSTPSFFTYLKKAKADVVEIEYGGLTGQDAVTGRIAASGLNAVVDSAGFVELIRNLMGNLHRMANQTMVDYFDFMIDYTWDDNYNDSFVLRQYSTRHWDVLDIFLG